MSEPSPLATISTGVTSGQRFARRSTRAVPLLGCLLFSLSFGCSDSAEPPVLRSGRSAVEAEVDRKGGVLELEGRARLTLPKGALAEATSLRVEVGELEQLAARPDEYEVIGEPLVITPHGLRLERPATIEIAIDDRRSAESELRVLRLDDTKDRSWMEIEGVRLADKGEESRFAADLGVERTGDDTVTAQRRLEFEVKTFSVFLPVRLVQGASCAGRARGVVCRESVDDCDVREVCDGQSAECPQDGVAGRGTQCRVSAGICDVAEVCDGEAIACPADGVRAEGSVCRPVRRNECDVAEVCDGEGLDCPEEGPAPVCDPPAMDGGLPSADASADAAPDAGPGLQLVFAARGNSYRDLDFNAPMGASVVVPALSTRGASLSDNGDGTYRYEPVAGEISVTDSFNVDIDGAPQSVTVNVGTAIWWADTSAGAGGNGSRTLPFNNSADALSNAGAGGTVVLKGTHGALTLLSDMELYGDQVGADLGDGVFLSSGATTVFTDAITLPASGSSHIQGVRLDGATAQVTGTIAVGEEAQLVDVDLRNAADGTTAINIPNSAEGGTLTLSNVDVSTNGGMIMDVQSLAALNIDVGAADPLSTFLSTGAGVYIVGDSCGGCTGTVLDAKIGSIDAPTAGALLMQRFQGSFRLDSARLTGTVESAFHVSDSRGPHSLTFNDVVLTPGAPGSVNLSSLVGGSVALQDLDIDVTSSGGSAVLNVIDVEGLSITESVPGRNRLVNVGNDGLILFNINSLTQNELAPAGVTFSYVEHRASCNSTIRLLAPTVGGPFVIQGDGSAGSSGQLGTSGGNCANPFVLRDAADVRVSDLDLFGNTSAFNVQPQSFQFASSLLIDNVNGVGGISIACSSSALPDVHVTNTSLSNVNTILTIDSPAGCVVTALVDGGTILAHDNPATPVVLAQTQAAGDLNLAIENATLEAQVAGGTPLNVVSAASGSTEVCLSLTNITLPAIAGTSDETFNFNLGLVNSLTYEQAVSSLGTNSLVNLRTDLAATANASALVAGVLDPGQVIAAGTCARPAL